MEIESTEVAERGATLIEFALVLPLLMLVMVGIVDLGMRLADGHALEDGIRDATREMVVGNTGGDGGCVIVNSSTPNTETAELICLVKSRIGLPESDVRVRVVVGAGGAVTGEPLLVCSQYPGDSFTGLLPQFSSGTITARTVLRLEVDSPVVSFAETSHAGGWPQCSL
ncbi:MAG: pilus assembly protein [Acidimicrobiia bacterium]|nr:pilus assembly protein [Acidimicrobiia bacterium]